MSTPGQPPQDLLEGITGKTKKEELVTRINQMVDLAELGRATQTIAQTRTKWLAKGPTDTVHTVIVSATETEFLEALEFLQDLEDVLPLPLQRLLAGGRVMFEVEEAK